MDLQLSSPLKVNVAVAVLILLVIWYTAGLHVTLALVVGSVYAAALSYTIRDFRRVSNALGPRPSNYDYAAYLPQMCALFGLIPAFVSMCVSILAAGSCGFYHWPVFPSISDLPEYWKRHVQGDCKFGSSTNWPQSILRLTTITAVCGGLVWLRLHSHLRSHLSSHRHLPQCMLACGILSMLSLVLVANASGPLRLAGSLAYFGFNCLSLVLFAHLTRLQPESAETWPGMAIVVVVLELAYALLYNSQICPRYGTCQSLVATMDFWIGWAQAMWALALPLAIWHGDSAQDNGLPTKIATYDQIDTSPAV